MIDDCVKGDNQGYIINVSKESLVGASETGSFSYATGVESMMTLTKYLMLECEDLNVAIDIWMTWEMADIQEYFSEGIKLEKFM